MDWSPSLRLAFARPLTMSLDKKNANLTIRCFGIVEAPLPFEEHMDIYECFELFNSLINKKFVLHIEDGSVLEFSFTKANLKHFLGLQKLSDIKLLERKPQVIYNLIADKTITNKLISKSIYYNKIEDRLLYFYLIPKLLQSKIIIEFDSSLCSFRDAYSTKLENTDYILYKNMLEIDVVAHLTLSIINTTKERTLCYPETFFVEHSKRYISGQKLLNILSVEVIDHKKK